MCRLNSIIYLLLITFFILLSNAVAQNSENDSTDTLSTQVLNQNQPDTTSNELILDEINIKGEIDRPNVIIMPTRVETEVKKIELERKFSKEVNKIQGEIPELQEELRKIENIKSIKKTIKRDRLKNNNTEKKKEKQK